MKASSRAVSSKAEGAHTELTSGRRLGTPPFGAARESMPPQRVQSPPKPPPVPRPAVATARPPAADRFAEAAGPECSMRLSSACQWASSSRASSARLARRLIERRIVFAEQRQDTVPNAVTGESLVGVRRVRSSARAGSGCAGTPPTRRGEPTAADGGSCPDEWRAGRAQPE